MKRAPLLCLVSAALASLAPGQKPAKPAPPPKPVAIESPAGAQAEPPADPRAQQRTLVKMLVNVERAHRDRAARLDRLRELYTASGATAQLETVARLVQLEQQRYE